MGFFHDISIKGAGTDIVSYIRQDRDHNWLFWLVSCLPPALIILAFQLDAASQSTPSAPPPMYFESWSADRPLEDTLKAQAAAQQRKDEAERKKRETYRALARASGMDVEAIEETARAMEAESKARAKARAKAAEKAEAAGKTEAAAKTGAPPPTDSRQGPAQ